MKSWFHIISFLVITSALQAQAIRFYALTDAKEVTTNAFFQVSFVLENARGSSFVRPDFGQLTLVSGPSVSNEMQIVNGRSSSKMSYVFGLTASKPGTYQIGQASIRVNNKTYQSQAISVKVVQGREVSEISEDEQVFYRMEISDSIAYIGQQVRLDYVLYSVKDVRAQRFLSESSYDGFFARNVRDFSRAEKVILNNIQYTRDVIRTISLFPQQTGSYTIEPATVRVSIPIEGARSRGLFFGTPSKNKNFQSNSLAIDIRSLPQPAPESFSGAVGKFNMQCRIDKAGVKVGDALSLTMQISGNGDPKLVSAPLLEEIPGLDYFEPNLLNDESVENGGSILSKKSWEYLIVPEKAGTYRINPSFSYFDPDSARYISFYRGPFVINAGGTGGAVVQDQSTDHVLEESLQSIFLKTHLVGNHSGIFKSNFYWILLGLGFLTIISILIYRSYLIKEAGKDIMDVKALKARKVAEKRLKTAEIFMKTGEERSFYNEVSKTILHYVSDKLRIPAADLSKSNVAGKMTELNIPEENIQSFLHIIESCELALFARKPDGGMQSLYDETIRSIAEVEKFLG